MEPVETNAHSFVIRLRLEETATEASPALWRGHITHIPGNERHYLEDLDEIKRFIAPYLRSANVDISHL